MNRREFAGTLAATTTLSAGRVLGANDRIRIGLIGTGGRCQYLARLVKDLDGVEVTSACDVYEPRRLEAAEAMGPQAKPVADSRTVLDDKSIDAVIIGAPDHWHVALTLEAVAAGKDVYCEKPVTHTLEEGDRLIAGVEKSGRIMATGTQQRAWDHFELAREMVLDGRLGKVVYVQTYWYQNYYRRRAPKEPIDPAKLDWKRWLGSAPDQPFDEIKYRTWRFFWDFGGGSFTDLMTHWIDVVQWFFDTPSPLTITATGTNHLNTWLQCPDTVNASMMFGNYTATYDGSLISSVEDGGLMLRGTEGIMQLNRHGFAIYPEDGPKPGLMMRTEPTVVVQSTGDGTGANLRNWLDCIRSRKTPKADVRAGVAAARTSHLANQAMRQGKALKAG